MQNIVRLCLWPLVIISILFVQMPIMAEEERGIRMRGPKSTDVFPYDRYGPITSRDTLWNIALTVRPDSRLTVYQVMQALFQENPQAFVENNRNHLVEGQYIKIPSFERMMSIDSQIARKNTEMDEQAWQDKQPKIVKPKKKAAEPSVNKKDLDTVKVEINEQIKTLDSAQQQRLETIQNDVLDSIDGLQAILKENESLRQRLTSFSDKLGVMQAEVAKGKEIKSQMDDMIKLQQELLAKAEAREQQLLLEKQQAELEKNDFTSSFWFTVLMSTVPALLILSIAFFILRRGNKDNEQFAEDLFEPKAKAAKASDESKSLDDELGLDDDLSLDDDLGLTDDLSIDDELGLDDDLSLDDELDLDDELNLDDDLSIDLLEGDDKESEDDAIHLDDDDALDDLDDLEDILLDDDSDVETLEGGELGQGDLDSLLSGLDEEAEDEPAESVDEALPGGELNQNDLNDLLGSLDEEQADDEVDADSIIETDDVIEDEVGIEEIDIDEALEQASKAKQPSAELDESAEVTDPDDIDALLDSMGAESSDDKAEEETTAPAEEPATETSVADDLPDEVTDPDDIDALLDSMGTESSDDKAEEEVAPEASVADDLPDEVTDPDDIDALLDSMGAESSDDKAEEELPAESVPEASVADDLPDEVTDPDDIDALLDSMGTESSDDKAEEELPAESVPEASVADDLPDEVTDPDDIDALLDSMGAESSDDQAKEETTALAEEAVPESSVADDLPDEVTDPDDIDALLDSMGTESSDDKAEEELTAEPVPEASVADDLPDEVTDPDDIDALLDSMGTESSDDKAEEELTAEPVPEASVADDLPDEVTDPDDIDALLDSMGADVHEVEDKPVEEQVQSGASQAMATDALVDENEQAEPVDSENADKIAQMTAEYVEPFLTADFSDVLTGKIEDTQEPSSEEQVQETDADAAIDDEIDIDALISEVNDAANNEPSASDELLDVGDSLLDDSKAAVPDFSDENVLADLLSENEAEMSPDEVIDDVVEDADSHSQATEIEDIEELDNVDFDELLANIEEDNQAADIENAPILDDIGDSITETVEAEEQPKEAEKAPEKSASQDYVSVDDLLTESMLEVEESEPYDKANIDVGLNEYSEFAEDANAVDVDEQSDITGKLDLAKMYLEIGDNDNAQAALQEVINQGDSEQQAYAQELLDSIK